MAAGLAALLGMAFAAYTAEYLTWHWSFLVLGPLAIVTLAFAWRLPYRAGHGSRAEIDWQGAVLLFARADRAAADAQPPPRGPEPNFQEGSPLPSADARPGDRAAGLFVWVERRVPRPLLLIGMLRSPRFATASWPTAWST